MKALFNLLLSIPTALAGGFIFAHLWNWFIVRLFPSMPHMTFLDAIGVLIVLSFPLLSIHMGNIGKELREKHPDMDPSTQSIITSLVTLLVIYPILLGVAYLWHLAIG